VAVVGGIGGDVELSCSTLRFVATVMSEQCDARAASPETSYRRP